MAEGQPTWYLAAIIPETDCHVTLAFRLMGDEADQSSFLDAAHQLCAVHLPFELEQKGLIKVGKQRELTAVQLEVCDRMVADDLVSFWTTFQRRRPGREMFPFNPHATLKTEERVAQMELLPKRFRVTRVVMKRLEDKAVIKEWVVCAQVNGWTP